MIRSLQRITIATMKIIENNLKRSSPTRKAPQKRQAKESP
tara:strand:- start:91 stop:210 length:120 start_codon:yes stop_codon:yes gene_type:complete